VLLGQDICPNRFYCSATDVLTAPNHDNLDSLLIKINPPDSLQSNLKTHACLERASEPA